MTNNSASTDVTKEVKTWTTNQVILATLFVVCVFLLFLLLYRLRVVIFLFFVAIVIGTAIRPAVDWLYRRGIARPVGIIGIYVLLAGLMVGFLALVVPLLAEQGTQFTQNIPQYYEAVRERMLSSSSHLLQNLGLQLPPRLSLLSGPEPTTEEMFTQVNQTILYMRLVLKGILSTLAIFLLAFYWTQESNLAIRTVLRFIPTPRQRSLHNFITQAELKIGGYVRGQGILCVAVGIAAFIAYMLIGLPYALVLAIFAGLMEIVPVFGPALGAIPALLVALSVEPQMALWVLATSVVIQMMENAWLVPRIMKNSLGVNPILIILSLVTFGSVLGFAGAVLAIPLAAMLQLVLDHLILTPERTSALFPEERAVKEPIPMLEADTPWMESLQKATTPNGWLNALRGSEQREMTYILENLKQILKECVSQQKVEQ